METVKEARKKQVTGDNYSDDEKRQYFKQNYAIIRKSAGWSADKIASMLGVSRQTINNIEHREKYELTKSLYIASRALVENEIRNNPEDMIMTKLIMDAFVDKRDNYNEEERQEIKKNAEKLALAVVDKPENRKVVSTALVAAVAATIGAAMGAALLALSNKLFKK